MGGGDLNLKKSWHPSTLKNQERVWKAEQEKMQEDRKIAELQRELKEERLKEELKQAVDKKIEKNEGRDMNWMYKGPGSHVSREEYLLGRKVDKAFEMLEKEEIEKNGNHDQSNKSSYTVEHEINPESVIQKDEETNIQVDMKRKLLEDPLLHIRQNEEATKRAVTSNPVKMKQLQLLIESLKEKNKKKKKKKHKAASSGAKSKSKNKKSKKSKKKKDKKAKKKSKKRSKKESSSEEESSSSENNSEEKSGDEATEARRRMVMQVINRESKRVAELRQAQQEHGGSDNIGGHNSSKETMKRSERHWRERPNRERRSCELEIERERGRKPQNRSRSRSRSRSRRRDKRDHEDYEEEMRRKREEMMENALKREAQRKENVERYKKELEKEEVELQDADDFRRKFGSSVESSVESRIRSKASSHQRRNNMDNFLKK